MDTSFKPLSSLTLIDNAELRGVLAPAKNLSKKLLEDIVDLIELSNDKEMNLSANRIKDANHHKSWTPFSSLIKKARSAK